MHSAALDVVYFTLPGVILGTGKPMRRRKFISLLGSAATWPLVARAQQKVWKVGMLTVVSRQAFSGLYAAFITGMRELGHVEGKDFIVEWRSAEQHYERFPELIAELVGLKVDVIVCAVSQAYRALQRATDTIPIVMLALTTDPVGSGFVASLKHPGGNITGLTASFDDTAPKQVELLSMVVPNMARIGLLGDPSNLTYLPFRKSLEAAAAKTSLSVTLVEVSSLDQLDSAFQTFKAAGVQAFIGMPSALFFGEQNRFTQLALRNRLPSMFPQRDYAVAGGLMSYGENLSDFYYRAASFVDKIFKGAKPGDLPIEQPTRFHLVINRKTADVLGLTIPPQLFIFADEVIE
jgi:putative tryptophan/tyrosine transport system substrate-binding protein